MFSCVSVLGGWQTSNDDGELFGPIYDKITDLWAWQRINLTQKGE